MYLNEWGRPICSRTPDIGCSRPKNADEALQLLEINADVRLLFTDVTMPGSMNGSDLAGQVARRWPEVGVIVTSGRSRPESLPSGSKFHAKPYEPTNILQHAREITFPLECPIYCLLAKPRTHKSRLVDGDWSMSGLERIADSNQTFRGIRKNGPMAAIGKPYSITSLARTISIGDTARIERTPWRLVGFRNFVSRSGCKVWHKPASQRVADV